MVSTLFFDGWTSAVWYLIVAWVLCVLLSGCGNNADHQHAWESLSLAGAHRIGTENGQAATLFEQALVEAKHFGPHDLRPVFTLNSLGEVRLRQGDLEAARQSFHNAQVLIDSEQRENSNRPDTETLRAEQVKTLAGLSRIAEETNNPAEERTLLYELLHILQQPAFQESYTALCQTTIEQVREKLARISKQSEPPKPQSDSLKMSGQPAYSRVESKRLIAKIKTAQLLHDGRRFGEASAIYRSILSSAPINDVVAGAAAVELSELAQQFFDGGEYQQAGVCYAAVLNFRERKLGQNSPDLRATLLGLLNACSHTHNVTLVLASAGKLDKVLHAGIPYIVIDRHLQAVADAYVGAHHYSQALKLYEEVVSDGGATGITSRRVIAECCMGAACCYRNLGSYEQALKCDRRALEMINGFSGVPDEYRSRCLIAVANDSAGLNRTDESLALLMQDIDTTERVKGKLDPNYVSICVELGIALRQQRRFDESERYLRKALALRETGSNIMSTCNVVKNLACTYLFELKFDECISLLEPRVKGFSDMQPDRCQIELLRSLGAAYGAKKVPDKAERCLRSAIKASEALRKSIEPVDQKALRECYVSYGFAVSNLYELLMNERREREAESIVQQFRRSWKAAGCPKITHIELRTGDKTQSLI